VSARRIRDENENVGADPNLVKLALQKRGAGKTPNRAEASALRAYEKEREEADRRRFYASIPKKHWCELSGRAVQVLNQQAIRYGIPVGEATIDLGKLARWLHDLLRDKGDRILSSDDADASLSGPFSQALEEYRREQTRIARLKRLDMEKTLVPRKEVHQVMSDLAALIRGGIEMLQLRHGNEAAEIIRDCLDQYEARLTALDEPNEGTP
jgi:hypothetical protein